MTIRQDNSTTLILDIDKINNKIELRKFILNKWMTEIPSCKYRYFVEDTIQGNKIYLERPGKLNKGCDFIIYIENRILHKNGNDKPPKHDFILLDLKHKKENLNAEQWSDLLQAITNIFKCLPFHDAYLNCTNLPKIGEDYDLILKMIRWMFIEQDITYWSGFGREMLFNHILNL